MIQLKRNMASIELTKDKKSPTWIITTTDSQGFHRQLNVTREQMDELLRLWLVERVKGAPSTASV